MSYDSGKLLENILEGDFTTAEDTVKEELNKRRDAVKTEAKKAIAESVVVVEGKKNKDEDCDDDEDDDDDSFEESYRPPIRKKKGEVKMPRSVERTVAKFATKYGLTFYPNKKGLSGERGTTDLPIAEIRSLRNFAPGHFLEVYYDGQKKLDIVFRDKNGDEIAYETADTMDFSRVFSDFIEEII